MTTKKHFLFSLILFILLFITNTSYSQVTIGSNATPNADALLDLKENASNTSTKGLLLPRVSLSSTTLSAPLSAHVSGMVVYNLSTTADVTPGYYLNDGSRWFKLAEEKTSALPSFFYMPSIVLPIDTSDPTYNTASQSFVLDLYQLYKIQFGLENSVSSVKSPSASTLPIITNNNLEYFITYYDSTVFQNVSLSNTGVLTYKVFPEIRLTDKSYMNILFKIK